MRWQGRRQSSNVEDRRSSSGRRVASFGGIGTIVIVLIVWLLGGNPGQVLQMLQTGEGGVQQTENYTSTPHEEELKSFLGVVLADTEDVWTKIFDENGMTYRQPTLLLFNNSIQSACGFSSAATGPFYCPGDEKVYIDMAFLEDMQKQLQSPGDFVQAYIIAHEVGHHVQKLMGIMDRYSEMQGKVSEVEFNRLTVRLELQADFFAGVWAHHANKMKNILEEGDIEEAMTAANAIGDDRLQKQATGHVVPDSFTHGTSEQRMSWFMKGFKTGDIKQGDTFSTQNL